MRAYNWRDLILNTTLIYVTLRTQGENNKMVSNWDKGQGHSRMGPPNIRYWVQVTLSPFSNRSNSAD